MYVCMYVCTHMCVCICTHIQYNTYVYMYINTCTYMHYTCSMHKHARTYVHTGLKTNHYFHRHGIYGPPPASIRNVASDDGASRGISVFTSELPLTELTQCCCEKLWRRIAFKKHSSFRGVFRRAFAQSIATVPNPELKLSSHGQIFGWLPW